MSHPFVSGLVHHKMGENTDTISQLDSQWPTEIGTNPIGRSGIRPWLEPFCTEKSLKPFRLFPFCWATEAHKSGEQISDRSSNTNHAQEDGMRAPSFPDPPRARAPSLLAALSAYFYMFTGLMCG